MKILKSDIDLIQKTFTASEQCEILGALHDHKYKEAELWIRRKQKELYRNLKGNNVDPRSNQRYQNIMLLVGDIGTYELMNQLSTLLDEEES